MMKKILVFVILFSFAFQVSAEVKLATLINVITGVKRVVVVGEHFRENEVLFGAKLGARTDNTYRVYSGGIYATSTSNLTATMTVAEIGQSNTIWYTPNKWGSFALTMFASTTNVIAPNVGDVKTFYIRNATTTANMTISLVAGTGSTFIIASSTTGSIIHANKGARLEYLRRANTDFDVFLQTFNN